MILENQLSSFADPHASRGTSDPHVMYNRHKNTLEPMARRPTHPPWAEAPSEGPSEASRQLGNDMS